jgi:hypothetical protein
VSAYEMGYPDGGDRAATVSAFEMEVGNAARKAQISAYEMETENGGRAALVSVLEFEVVGAPQQARVSAFELSLGSPGDPEGVPYQKIHVKIGVGI